MKIKIFLIDQGFSEVINSPFTEFNEESSIKVDNPLDKNRQYLRTNLMNSLIDNLNYNEKRQKDSVKFFEISDIYFSKKGLLKVNFSKKNMKIPLKRVFFAFKSPQRRPRALPGHHSATIRHLRGHVTGVVAGVWHKGGQRGASGL